MTLSGHHLELLVVELSRLEESLRDALALLAGC